MIKYTVISLDVWAGDEEGMYDKNDFFDVGTIELPEDFTEQTVLNVMIQEGYLTAECSLVTVEVRDYNSDGQYLELVEISTGKPIFDLREVE